MEITSFKQFNLDTNINKAIIYDTPTPIQKGAIPAIMAGRDVIGSAKTGTGKTAAFVLPSLDLLTKSESNIKPRILILTPTRELAAQITTAAATYGKFMRFNIISLVGGMPYRQQLRDLSRQVDIVVATPGRLLDHMKSRKIDLSKIQMLILDEADRMLDMGFIDDVREIAQATPASRQTLLFSATVDGKLTGVIRDLLKNPVRIEVEHEKNQPILIKQELYVADNHQHKARLLQHFLDNGNIFKGIIFSATKINCDNLANQLMDQGYSAAALHGDLKQNVRNRTVELLRRGKIQFLVATDIAARGIDISDVTHVINYDLPKFSEDYVHRIGRTGRAGKTGVAISFALPMDARHLQKIERYTGQRIQVEVIAGLEPTKRMGSTSGAGSSDRGKRSGGGGYKGNGAKGGYKSGGKSFSDKPYSSKSRSDDARSENPRASRFANERSEAPRARTPRFDDARSEAPRSRSSASRSEAPRERGSRFDGARSEAPRGRGARSENPRFEGARSERPSSSRSDAPRSSSARGSRFEGGRSDGPRSSSPRFDGARSDSPRSSSPRFEGARSDSPRSSSSRFEGARSDSPRSNSPRFEGARSDSRKSSSPRFEGARSESPRSSAPKARGARFDGARSEGARSDRASSPRSDTAAPRARGARFDGARSGGVRSAAVKGKSTGGRNQTGRNEY